MTQQQPFFSVSNSKPGVKTMRNNQHHELRAAFGVIHETMHASLPVAVMPWTECSFRTER